jgi:uncharacterized repeat protein (TIGR01451 family)
MSALKSFHGGRSRRLWVIGATLLVAATFGVVFIGSSGAAPVPCPIPGNFEIDGDMTQATCDPAGDDWDTPNIGVQSTTQGGTYNTANKDDSNPSNWTSSGSTPNKTDFAQAYATSRVVNGHFFVFVAWERSDTTGTQGYAIEITNSGSSVGSDGTPQPNRGGGGNVFYLSSQGAKAPAFDSACSYHTQSDYGQTCTTSDASVTAAINTASISDPLNNTTQPAGGFFEVALDVTGLTGIEPSCPGAAANTVYLRSITGQTSNGNLKGYMAPLEVAPNSTCVAPPIETTATPGGSTNLPGTAQHDTVKVGTQAAPGIGSVEFFLCSPAEVTANGGDCSADGTQVGTAVTLDGTGSGSSGTVNGSTTPNDNAPGKYCWRAEFTPGANDHNYLAGSHTNSDTECFKILATPSISTSQDPGSGGLGLTYKDKAILSAGSNPTGTITFDLYDNPNCSGQPLYEESVSVGSGNGTYETANGVQLNSAATYYWVATYGGDSNNKSAVSGCADEPVTVAPNQPSIVTTPSPSSVTLGTSSVTLKDSAVLSGGSSPTGSITFTLVYKGSTLDTETVQVSGNGTYSTPIGFTLPTSSTVTGTYQWNASYSGDLNNNQASENNDPLERVTVSPASPSVVTTASDPVKLPGSVTFSDSAVVSGGYAPTGTLTFTLSGPNGFSYTQTDTVSGNGTYTASDGPIVNPDAGTYTWSVSYSGDGNNDSAVDQGGTAEQTVVSPATPSITTTQDPASGSSGDTYKDKAILSGGSNPSGTITFDLYDNPNCTGQPLYEENASVANGNGTYETANGVKLDSAGTYYWVATYGGDSNNEAAVSGCADEPVVVKGAAIHIAKTADADAVNVGDQIGFTITVYNSGDGDAHDVVLKDPLPTNPGLAWTIDTTGAGWGSSCSISSSNELDCGPATVPAGMTKDASTFTVHITSATTPATGGDCPGTGVVDNTASVTTSNDGSDESSASTCVQALVDLSVTKSGSPASQELGAGNITWTMVVTNNGPNADTNVVIADPMPAGNTFVSATTTKGTCTGGAILNCSIGPMAAGESVTITLVTTPSAAGTQTNTVTVAGDRPETNTGNNTASATVQIVGPHVPPAACVAVSRVTPKQLFVGRKTKLTIHVTQAGKAVKGVHVRIKGAKINIRTQASNSKGVITRTVKLKKAGILIFSPIASKRCNTKRVGVTNVFTPPVTG